MSPGMSTLTFSSNPRRERVSKKTRVWRSALECTLFHRASPPNAESAPRQSGKTLRGAAARIAGLLQTVKLSTGRDLQYFAALAFAYARDDARAKALANDLDKSYPEDTIVQFNYLPTVRGRLALNRGDASAAIASLGFAVPYELGRARAIDLDWTAMFPVFVRGEAYLAAHKGSEAAAEFQKILDHRGLVLNQPIGALAHLGLGRAYVLQGDIPKGKAAYQDFLALWKDADPDIPILKQAKAEYAKLQ